MKLSQLDDDYMYLYIEFYSFIHYYHASVFPRKIFDAGGEICQIVAQRAVTQPRSGNTYRALFIVVNAY